MLFFLRLIGKQVVDLQLVIIELFLLGVTAEALRANIEIENRRFCRTGSIWPKILGTVSLPHQPFFSVENYFHMV